MGLFAWLIENKKRTRKNQCARCKKALTESEIHWIGNHKFCEKCYNTPKASIIHRNKPIDEKTLQTEENAFQEPTCPPVIVYCANCSKSITRRIKTPFDAKHPFCEDCYSTIKYFKIICYTTYLGSSAASEAFEHLLVLPLKDRYVIKYMLLFPSGPYGDSTEVPFGFFSSSSAEMIADKLNSVSYNGVGFGIYEKRKFTENDILNNEEMQRLIAYDKPKLANS